MSFDTQTTEDIETELRSRRRVKKAKLLHGAKTQATGATALLVAAFGAYEGYTNKEVAGIAAQIAAEAKVDGAEDREALVAEINALKEENAILQSEVTGQKELNKERYEHLKEWLYGLRRGPQPAAARRVIDVPKPKPPKVEKVSKTRPQKSDGYEQQVRKVLKERGF